MMKIIKFDGTCRVCSTIEFASLNGNKIIVDEGEEYIDLMEVVRIVPIKAKREVSLAQFEKLKEVLIDNGIELDEADIVAEACCYVTDLDMPNCM